MNHDSFGWSAPDADGCRTWRPSREYCRDDVRLLSAWLFLPWSAVLSRSDAPSYYDSALVRLRAVMAALWSSCRGSLPVDRGWIPAFLQITQRAYSEQTLDIASRVINRMSGIMMGVGLDVLESRPAVGIDVSESELLRCGLVHACLLSPQAYGLSPDALGWLDLEDLCDCFRGLRSSWSTLTAADVAVLLSSSRQRSFELANGRIRAAINETIEGDCEVPPVLYVSGNRSASGRIQLNGVCCHGDQMVMLRSDRQTAERVAQIYAAPTLLTVNARSAGDSHFQRFGQRSWVTRNIDTGAITEIVALRKDSRW